MFSMGVAIVIDVDVVIEKDCRGLSDHLAYEPDSMGWHGTA